MLRRGAAALLMAGLAAGGCGGSSGPKLLGTGRPATYRITYQTRHYTNKAWSRWFQIADHVGRGLAGQQDLVVMRRRR